jgi:hypothetical protein
MLEGVITFLHGVAYDLEGLGAGAGLVKRNRQKGDFFFFYG